MYIVMIMITQLMNRNFQGGRASVSRRGVTPATPICTVVVVVFSFFAALSSLCCYRPVLGFSATATSATRSSVTVPKVSPATGLDNMFYEWKAAQQIRYQVSGPENGEPVVLIHGLFVNSDHWRKSLIALGNAGFRTYALDLWGCGYSDKPPANSATAQQCNGETPRFGSTPSSSEETLERAARISSSALWSPPVMEGVERGVPLGTVKGGNTRRICDVDLRHPLGSPYNFYTWADLIADFCREIVLTGKEKTEKATLVCNSIGTISTLQAATDAPELVRGVFSISPNFRELHSAEVPFPGVTMPVLRQVQRLLRSQYGQKLFDAAATPKTVKQILMEPYAVTSAVDDTLVEVLLDPLLTPGASKVVFDTLSYSAGPLPEQQLQSNSFPSNVPVWIGYGLDDPWIPGPRVEALQQYEPVQRVQGWPGVGHCPHDEAPEIVHPMVLEFLDHLKKNVESDEEAMEQ